MHPSISRRVSIGACSLTLAAVLCTACLPSVSWQAGGTHGAVVETGAARAGVNIYRSARSALYQVWDAGGIGVTQDAMWAFGKPPRFSVCFAGLPCITQAQVASKIKGWIYGDAWDLKGGLLDAQAAHDCLSLTLISHAAYIKNWTHKQVGCYLGSPSGAPMQMGADGAPTDAGGERPMLTNGTTEASDPGDYIPTDYLQPAP